MKRSADFSCSLFKLRLKFVQTTRVVCTDFAEVLRIGKANLFLLTHTNEIKAYRRPCRMR